jgi:TolB-like protein
LSIVVLPFTNLSDDREQQYFADGITEDLTTDLSRIAGMFVISRNTAFTYRNKPIDTKQIGRELGVRYVLEGGVRRSSNQLRVNAQLIDAVTDAHLWAERFDRDIADLFALQDAITSRIAIALNLELIFAEAARRPIIPTHWTTFSGGAPRCQRRRRATAMLRRLAWYLITGSAGSVAIHAGSLVLSNGGFISAQTTGSGTAGDVLVNVSGDLSIDGRLRPGFSAPSFGTGIVASTENVVGGNGGQIAVRANNLQITMEA